MGWLLSLLWRHNERDGVSNHQPHDGLLNLLFRHRSKKTSKLRVTGLCKGNSSVTDRASQEENVSIWWCHHGEYMYMYFGDMLSCYVGNCTVVYLPTYNWLSSTFTWLSAKSVCLLFLVNMFSVINFSTSWKRKKKCHNENCENEFPISWKYRHRENFRTFTGPEDQ